MNSRASEIPCRTFRGTCLPDALARAAEFTFGQKQRKAVSLLNANWSARVTRHKREKEKKEGYARAPAHRRYPRAVRDDSSVHRDRGTTSESRRGGDIARGASASGRGEPHSTGNDEAAGEEKEKARAGPNGDGGVGGPERVEGAVSEHRRCPLSGALWKVRLVSRQPSEGDVCVRCASCVSRRFGASFRSHARGIDRSGARARDPDSGRS